MQEEIPELSKRRNSLSWLDISAIGISSLTASFFGGLFEYPIYDTLSPYLSRLMSHEIYNEYWTLIHAAALPAIPIATTLLDKGVQRLKGNTAPLMSKRYAKAAALSAATTAAGFTSGVITKEVLDSMVSGIDLGSFNF